MNPDTGHLVRIDTEEERRLLARAGYIPLPEELIQAARRKLAGKKEAQVSLTSGGELSKWAAEQRKKKREQRKKAKAKRKTAKKSKQLNRKRG